MNSAKQVIVYLEDLARELIQLGIRVEYHFLFVGGAYMLLQNNRRSTEDIDFALIASQRRPRPNKAFRTTVQHGSIASRRSAVPGAAIFKQAAATVAARYNLPVDWMNDEVAGYLYEDAPNVEVVFWRSFQNVLFVYLPTREYIFATKVAAYRRKDAKDIQVLIRELNIRTREEAQAIIDAVLLPEAQQFYEIPKKLKRLFH